MAKKKQKAKEETKSSIFILYDQTRSGGEALSDEAWSDREDEYIDTEFKGFRTERPEGYAAFNDYETVEVPANYLEKKDLYAVVIYYTDGDTFGCTHGYFDIVSVHTSSKEANATLEKELKAVNQVDNYKGSEGYRRENGYRPWFGYFASLDDGEVVRLERWN